MSYKADQNPDDCASSLVLKYSKAVQCSAACKFARQTMNRSSMERYVVFLLDSIRTMPKL